MAKQHVVVEDIDATISAGMAVRDASGERICSVKDFSSAAAYVEVQTGLVAHKNLFVPYSAIKGIDPHEVYLNLDRAVLARHHNEPPQARTVVKGRSATLVVTSWYDGSPKVVNRVDLVKMRRDLTKGLPIFDRNGDWIGTVDGIDEHAGYLVAKRNRFSQQDLFIPFTAIGAIDRQIETALGQEWRRVVYLAISKDVLLKEHSRFPDGVVLHIDRSDAPT